MANQGGNAAGTIEFTPNVLGPDVCDLSGESINYLERGCKLAVPLCPFSNQGGEIPVEHEAKEYSDDYRLFCLRMGILEITHTGDEFDEEEDGGFNPTPLQPYETPCNTRKTNIICGRFECGRRGRARLGG